MKLWQSSTLWKYTAAEMRRRPSRTLLTLAGIVIGVAATVAVTLSVQSTREAQRDMFEAVCGRASLEVVAEGLSPFVPDVIASLRTIPSVRAAVPVIQVPAAVLGKSGAVPVMLLGIDPFQDQAARDYSFRQGQMLARKNDLILSATLAESQGWAIGQQVRIIAAQGLVDKTICGLLEPRGAATFNGGAVGFVPIDNAQADFGMTDRVNAIQLVINPTTNQSNVASAIRGQLPVGLTLQLPDARGALGREASVSNDQGLATLSTCSLVAGGFVILNAFLMNLGERRRQLAILRALGATRNQITRLLLTEALVLGSVGTVFGISLGLALAMGLRQGLGQIMHLTLPDPHWIFETILIAMLLGPGLAIAATFEPARRAGRRAPLEDLLQKKGLPPAESRRWPCYVGLGFIAVTTMVVCGISQDWFPPEHAVAFLAPFMALCLVGCVLAIPLILKPLARCAAILVEPLMRPEGGLAIRHLMRHETRTALTAGVLMIAVMFGLGFGQSLLNNMSHIRDWFDRVLYADFYVRASWPDSTAYVTAVGIPETIAPELRAWDGIARVDQFKYLIGRACGRPVVIMAFSFDPNRRPPMLLDSGENHVVLDRMLHGEVIVGAALAQRQNLRAGDSISVETPRGPESLRIAGIASEYTGGGMALYLEWKAADKLFDLSTPHTLIITAKAGAAADLSERLKTYCYDHGLLVQSNAETHEFFEAQIAAFLSFVWGLIGLVFVVASLGIVNTLTMSVLEQTRELGVLRAIGMKRRQLAKMILAQALTLGIISLLPGTLAGMILAYAMNVTAHHLVGQPVPFLIDYRFVAGSLGAALVITILAAWFPARRAARLPVIQALQYE